jgi:putative transposase
MDGRGRVLDNIFVERLWRSVKHEDVYLKDYALMHELLMGLTEYLMFYNTEKPHKSLDYSTPDHVYKPASGGGARIMDKYSETEKTHSAIESKKKQNQSSSVPLRMKGYPLKLGALLS